MKRTLEVGFIVALAAAGAALGLRLANGNWHVGIRPVIVARAQTVGAVGVGYKTLTVMSGDLMSPLFITRVTIGKKAMILGAPMSAREQRSNPSLIFNERPFQAGGDWLKNMTIYVKNRTDKAVAWVSVGLFFPDTGNGTPGEPISGLNIPLGRIPTVDIPTVKTADGKPLHLPPSFKPLGLQPGQEVVVHLADYMDRIKSVVENVMPLSMVAKLKVGISDCYFNDGMRWGGYYSVPDSIDPSKMKNLPSHYFPGNPRQHWPPGL